MMTKKEIKIEVAAAFGEALKGAKERPYEVRPVSCLKVNDKFYAVSVTLIQHARAARFGASFHYTMQPWGGGANLIAVDRLDMAIRLATKLLHEK